MFLPIHQYTQDQFELDDVSFHILPMHWTPTPYPSPHTPPFLESIHHHHQQSPMNFHSSSASERFDCLEYQSGKEYTPSVLSSLDSPWRYVHTYSSTIPLLLVRPHLYHTNTQLIHPDTSPHHVPSDTAPSPSHSDPHSIPDIHSQISVPSDTDQAILLSTVPRSDVTPTALPPWVLLQSPLPSSHLSQSDSSTPRSDAEPVDSHSSTSQSDPLQALGGFFESVLVMPLAPEVLLLSPAVCFLVLSQLWIQTWEDHVAHTLQLLIVPGSH